MSKTLLVAVGIILGLSTLANAVPKHHRALQGFGAAYGYQTDIPGESQQDKFVNSY